MNTHHFEIFDIIFFSFIIYPCRPEWKDKLNPYRIEAAWKLASWENLDSYLDEASGLFI